MHLPGRARRHRGPLRADRAAPSTACRSTRRACTSSSARTTVPWREGMRRMAKALHPDRVAVSSPIPRVACVPLRADATPRSPRPPSSWPPCEPSSTTRTRRSAGWTTRRCLPAELRPPGRRLPGGVRGRGGGGRGRAAPARRRRGGDQADVRPPRRPFAGRGGGAPRRPRRRTACRSATASARLDTGPKQVHAQRLYRSAGYVEVPPYNDNPFACFWGEKLLA